MNMFETLKKSISTMKAEQIKAEISKIQLEKAKRYEYHKAYNKKKKEFENEIFETAKKMNLIK